MDAELDDRDTTKVKWDRSAFSAQSIRKLTRQMTTCGGV